MTQLSLTVFDNYTGTKPNWNIVHSHQCFRANGKEQQASGSASNENVLTDDMVYLISNVNRLWKVKGKKWWQITGTEPLETLIKATLFGFLFPKSKKLPKEKKCFYNEGPFKK